jgi:hypothetical protein
MQIASTTSGSCFDLVVDFRRADAHAAGIERRVRAAMDDHAAMLGPFGEIAMAPDIVEAGEIGGVVFRAVGSFQNITGMEGKGLVQTSSPFSPRTGLALVVPDVDGQAEPAPGSRPRQTGLSRIAEHEAADDVGAAGDRGQLHVGLMPLVDEGETLLGDSGEPVEADMRSFSRGHVVLRAAEAGLAQASIYLAEVPKMVMPSSRRIVEEHAPSGWKGEPSNSRAWRRPPGR